MNDEPLPDDQLTTALERLQEAREAIEQAHDALTEHIADGDPQAGAHAAERILRAARWGQPATRS